MAYIKNNWVDREGTTRYFETVDDDGALIFTPDYTQVTELGTPVNADNMNHIEEGIAAGSFTKFDLNATYAKDDLVTVIEEALPVIYKSLQDNNIGNGLSNSAYWEKISLGGGGGGLEIGDIGFTQMAIDETKGKRRKLNGQLIIQDQYVQFTNIIKNSVALNPDLACTEAEWQTEVTMNTFGLCGKFVIDNGAGTIRLPKYPDYFIGGVNNIAPVAGNGLALGLTDGANNVAISYTSGNPGALRLSNTAYGLPYGNTDKQNFAMNTMGVTTDSTKSGIEAQIKQEKIVGTYFIQVATGSETEENIINEIELNNPFSLLDVKWSDKLLNNISWLRSEGQANSKAIYNDVYALILREYNSGTDETETVGGVSVTFRRGSETNIKVTTDKSAYNSILSATGTAWYYVLDTSNETFYLPQSDGFLQFGGDGNFVEAGLPDHSHTTTMNRTSKSGGDTATVWSYDENRAGEGSFVSGLASESNPIYGNSNTVQPNAVKGYLYFYVGETVQNANLINAGRIEEKLVNKVDKESMQEVPCIVETYVNGTSGYRTWSDKYHEEWGRVAGTGLKGVTFLKQFANTNYTLKVTNRAPDAKTNYSNETPYVNTITTQGFKTFVYSTEYNYWEASGYIA